jgi:hypothetical protein
MKPILGHSESNRPMKAKLQEVCCEWQVHLSECDELDRTRLSLIVNMHYDGWQVKLVRPYISSTSDILNYSVIGCHITRWIIVKFHSTNEDEILEFCTWYEEVYNVELT